MGERELHYVRVLNEKVKQITKKLYESGFSKREAQDEINKLGSHIIKGGKIFDEKDLLQRLKSKKHRLMETLCDLLEIYDIYCTKITIEADDSHSQPLKLQTLAIERAQESRQSKYPNENVISQRQQSYGKLERSRNSIEKFIRTKQFYAEVLNRRKMERYNRRLKVEEVV